MQRRASWLTKFHLLFLERTVVTHLITNLLIGGSLISLGNMGITLKAIIPAIGHMAMDLIPTRLLIGVNLISSYPPSFVISFVNHRHLITNHLMESHHTEDRHTEDRHMEDRHMEDHPMEAHLMRARIMNLTDHLTDHLKIITMDHHMMDHPMTSLLTMDHPRMNLLTMGHLTEKDPDIR